MNKNIIIVSGLPRSGTSMMMKMLEAGGLDILKDNMRAADEDNPGGYYELESVKKIRENSLWLDKAIGKAFKMVSKLIYDLPAEKHYKIIFMERHMDEILASQKKMLKRMGNYNEFVDEKKLSAVFNKHIKEVKGWLDEQRNFEVLYVSYNFLIEFPERNIKKINLLLEDKLNIEKMLKVIDKSLYRQREYQLKKPLNKNEHNGESIFSFTKD